MQNVDLDKLNGYTPSSILDEVAVRGLIGHAGFRNKKDTLAIISVGGTQSSGYGIHPETIYPTAYSPTEAKLKELNAVFGIASKNFSYISLLTKDSREIDEDDARFLLDFVDSIDNERVVVLIGTYGYPNAVMALDQFLTKPKTIGVTGSIIPSCVIQNDCDINTGGVVAAVNTAHMFSNAENKSNVFGVFHGEIHTAEQCKSLNLHEYIDDRLVCLGDRFVLRGDS